MCFGFGGWLSFGRSLLNSRESLKMPPPPPPNKKSAGILKFHDPRLEGSTKKTMGWNAKSSNTVISMHVAGGCTVADLQGR